MGPGETPPLSRVEMYKQIVGRLATKVYKGQHMHCPAHTSTTFGAEETNAEARRPGVKETHKVPMLFYDAGR